MSNTPNTSRVHKLSRVPFIHHPSRDRFLVLGSEAVSSYELSELNRVDTINSPVNGQWIFEMNSRKSPLYTSRPMVQTVRNSNRYHCLDLKGAAGPIVEAGRLTLESASVFERGEQDGNSTWIVVSAVFASLIVNSISILRREWVDFD
jgi:hypothetical protein